VAREGGRPFQNLSRWERKGKEEIKKINMKIKERKRGLRLQGREKEKFCASTMEKIGKEAQEKKKEGKFLKKEKKEGCPGISAGGEPGLSQVRWRGENTLSS